MNDNTYATRTALDDFRLATVTADEGDEISVTYTAASSGTEQTKTGTVTAAVAEYDERLGRWFYTVEFDGDDNDYRVTGTVRDEGEDAEPTIFSVRYDWSNGERVGERGTHRVSERGGVTGVETN